MTVRAIPGSGPDPDIVAKLEQALEKARSGDVIAMGFVLQLRDGSVATSFDHGHSPRSSIWALLGGVHHLGRRIDEYLVEP